ncbi:MAG: UbiA family prenyltransferase [Bacteroidia bacterium]|nr:UbiA family prenyltransferase [Bacteroidia bacterium]
MHLLKRLIDFLVFGNIYIAACVLALYFATCIINSIPVALSPTAVFIFSSTCLYYNFHHHSNNISLRSLNAMIASFRSLGLSRSEKVSGGICILLLLYSLIYIPAHILFIFIVSGLFSMMYSLPLLPYKGKVRRLREFLHFKLPFLSASYALVTVLVPLFEYRLDIAPGPVFLQAISRALFIYGLCIPFEIRDLDKERKWGVRTIPVVYGVRATKMIGILILLLSILFRHILYRNGWMEWPVVLALDASFVVAMIWIVWAKTQQSRYYSKFFVDGTMILQLFFVYLAVL